MNYFSDNELRCKCGCGKLVHEPKALAKLNALRQLAGRPLILTSAYRCENHPNEVSKSKPGTHNQGIAFDIKTTPAEQVELIPLALSLGFKGFGLAKTFLHVDCREQDHVSAWHY